MNKFNHLFCSKNVSFAGYWQPIPLNTETEMTAAKFRISSCFAQITSIVSCFRKYHSKVLKRFSVFEIAILAVSHKNGRKLCILFSLIQINAIISINILGLAHGAFFAVSKVFIWFLFLKLQSYNILGRYKYLHQSSWAKGLILANFNTIKSPLVQRIWSRI